MDDFVYIVNSSYGTHDVLPLAYGIFQSILKPQYNVESWQPYLQSNNGDL